MLVVGFLCVVPAARHVDGVQSAELGKRGKPMSSTTPTTAGVADQGIDLVCANRLVGAVVYGLEGDRLGTIHDLVLDRQTGRVACAVLAFGGFLGIAQKYWPLPWEMLRADTARRGYAAEISRSQIEGSPQYANSAFPDWADIAYGQRVNDCYGIPYTRYR